MEKINQPFEHKPNEYTTMGNSLAKVEVVAFLLVVVGLLSKFVLNWQGGGLALIPALSILAMIYFPISLVYAGISGKYPKGIDKALMIICGLMLGIGCIGILFSFQQWPGSRMNIYLSLLLWVPTTIVALLGVLKVINIVPAATKWVLLRAAIIALPLWFMAFTSPMELYGMVGLFRNNPKYMELYVQCRGEERNDAACDEMAEFHKAYRLTQDFEKRGRMENGEWID